MASKTRGSGFRDEISESLLALRRLCGCWKHNFDDVGQMATKCPRCFQPLKRTASRRPGDLFTSYHGLSVLLELKEITATSIPWDRLEDHQQRSLQAVAASGGVGLVLVRWCLERAPRAFAVDVEHWGGLTRKSLPLADGDRPLWALELRKARILTDPGQGIPNPLVWDLRPVLDAYLLRHFSRIPKVRPDLFPTLKEAA